MLDITPGAGQPGLGLLGSADDVGQRLPLVFAAAGSRWPPQCCSWRHCRLASSVRRQCLVDSKTPASHHIFT
jgi:hypothetical protein